MTPPHVDRETGGDVVRISSDAAVPEARAVVLAVADRAGFDDASRAELAIVVSELATNLLTHAGGGDLVVEQVAVEDVAGIRIESRDAGPGIVNVDAALADGVSTVGSLGGGLGAVNRLMDELDITTNEDAERGTRVVATRWVRPRHESTLPSPLSVDAASRPKVPGTPNGDAFVIKQWNDTLLVGVIDGLGHGQYSSVASTHAKRYVERHFDRPFESLFRGVERACKGTRGVVLALARFDWAAGTVTFGGVGNIDYVTTAGDLDRFVTRRGVVGANAPPPIVAEQPWPSAETFVLYSDGIGSRWRIGDYEDRGDAPSRLAQRILADHGTGGDDATVLVVAPRGDDDG